MTYEAEIYYEQEDLEEKTRNWKAYLNIIVKCQPVSQTTCPDPKRQDYAIKVQRKRANHTINHTITTQPKQQAYTSPK